MVTFNEIENELKTLDCQKKYFDCGYIFWTQDEDGQIYAWKNKPKRDNDIQGWYPKSENDNQYENVIEIHLPKPINWKKSIIDLNALFGKDN